MHPRGGLPHRGRVRAGRSRGGVPSARVSFQRANGRGPDTAGLEARTDVSSEGGRRPDPRRPAQRLSGGMSMEQLLHIEDLHVEVEGREIIKGLNLTLNKGEIHAIMGPNGSGKSTLAYVLTGRPGYEVTAGRVLYRGDDILQLQPDERAQRGIFL